MEEEKRVEVHREERTTSAMVSTTFIKYASYLIIFFGVLWFLISYVFPMF